MSDAVPAELPAQVSRARAVVDRHLGRTLLAAYLYGSAVDGGLQPGSDIDLLIAVSAPPDGGARQALMRDLLEVSAPPGSGGRDRPLEVTVLARDDVVPWRHPATRQLQFGEWQRTEIAAGRFEPAMVDPDLAILLTKARRNSIALAGPAAERLFDPVPERDFRRALSDTLALWRRPSDWAGDERHVVLTLARIWYSATTGRVASKQAAADWAIERLHAQPRSVLLEARQAYLGQGEERLASRADEVALYVHRVKDAAAKALAGDADPRSTPPPLRGPA